MPIDISIQQQESEGVIRLSSSVEIGGKSLEVWFEVPGIFRDYLTDTADPFLLAVLFPAMHAGLPIRIINRPVSRTLLRNLQDVQRAWSQWKPERYSVVSIDAPVADEPITGQKNALCAFTGGIDGAFVLWDNLVNKENPFPYAIEAMLYVEGLHIPLQEKDASRMLIKDLKKIADELPIEFITVRTNLRRFGNWHDFHGTALAACLSLFKKKFSEGLLGSSHPYAYLRFPWGSNPVTDRLMSSANFSILPYGNGFTRIQKMERLNTWTPYQQIVNVCTRSFHRNCGRCEKCIRTLLGYRALGATPPDTFNESALKPLRILTLRAFQSQEIKDYTSILHTARKLGRKSGPFFWLAVNILINKTVRRLLDFAGRETLPRFSRDQKRPKLYQHDS